MFKPHYGKCNGCGEQRLIVVKRGLCEYCNEKSKDVQNTSKRKVVSVKKKIPLQRRRKPTGELEVFKEVWQEAIKKAGYSDPSCRCCGQSLGMEMSPIFFSHLLAKSTFPSFRLRRDNIWLKCARCHQEWEFGDRTQPKFAEAVKERERLKTEYYTH